MLVLEDVAVFVEVEELVEVRDEVELFVGILDFVEVIDDVADRVAVLEAVDVKDCLEENVFIGETVEVLLAVEERVDEELWELELDTFAVKLAERVPTAVLETVTVGEEERVPVTVRLEEVDELDVFVVEWLLVCFDVAVDDNEAIDDLEAVFVERGDRERVAVKVIRAFKLRIKK